MVLIVVAHTVVQLTKRRTVDPATEIKIHPHSPKHSGKRKGWK
ncbi:Uncharacterised protein [Segatella copri]|nr:Uncharacterised protein [Segatella copri]